MISGLILAAGRGTRFGGERPKQFQILNDVPVLQHSILTFEQFDPLDSYGIVTSSDEENTVHEILDRVDAEACEFVHPGGDRRRDSVRIGLRQLESQSPSMVFIHDSARPGLRPELLERLLDAWQDSDLGIGGVVPTLPLRNTIKRIDPNSGIVEETLDREQLRSVQTPQLFDYPRLLEVHEDWEDERPVTDDASMLEHHGDRVLTVRGLEQNTKITRPGDLDVVARRMEANNDE